MQLFLIRHAPAFPRELGLGEADRPLTPRGRRRWRRAIRGIERLGLRFDRLYHSPWLRAVQTADPLHRLADESVVLQALVAPPGPALVEALRGGARVAVVGHEPWLTELLARLVFGDMSPAARVLLKRGGLAWLEGEARAGGMRLCGLYAPRALRRLGH